MSLSTFFGWSQSSSIEELPDIFPISVKRDDFIRVDMISTYSKILTDVCERINGIPDELAALLWDNCLKSASADGLVTMLSKAMVDKKDLFIVFDRAIKIIRPATSDEEKQIKADYAKSAKSSVGVFISFSNFLRSDMVRVYSALEFFTVSSLNKSMNLANAIQIKMSDMRGSVSLADASDVKSQGISIAKGLARGKDVLLDAKDIIETNKPDLTSVTAAIDFLNQKRSFYLGMPESYINGEQTGGLGTTGENDTKAIERGLKNYYFSIVKPVIEAIFGVALTYKSQDFRQVAQGLEALKTFELIGEDLISGPEKKKIIDQLFDFDTAEGQDL